MGVKMRELKFRAWHKKEKEMRIVNQISWYRSGIEISADGYWHDKKEKYQLMQFVGRKDANNVDVYEGDIILDSFANLQVAYEVVYNETLAAFMLRRYGDYYEFDNLADSAKVIGNIYDNPELIGYNEGEE